MNNVGVIILPAYVLSLLPLIRRNSYNIMRVKSAFEFAYQQLTAPSLPDESLLARILR